MNIKRAVRQTYTYPRSCRRRGISFPALAGMLLLLFTLVPRVPAQGVQILISTLADTSTPIPGTTSPFTGFLPADPSITTPAPSINGTGISFYGKGAPGFWGIYLWPIDPTLPASLLKIVDTNTAIPGGTENFTKIFGGPFNSGLNTLFLASGLGQLGVYLGPANPLTPGDPCRLLADLTTAIPGGGGELFTGFSPYATLDGNNAVFIGYGATRQGGYLSQNGTLSTLVDTDTAIPDGTGNFTNFAPTDPCRLIGSTVCFIGLHVALGTVPQAGVYLKNLSPVDPCRVVVDTQTQIPNTEASPLFFEYFKATSYDGTTVAFIGGETGKLSTIKQEGVYKITPSDPCRLVADTLTAVPGGIGNFLSFSQVVIDPGVVVFEGLSDDGAGGTRKGLYTDYGGTLTKIVATGDTIGGKTLTNLRFGPYGFGNDGTVVFAAAFSDGSEAVIMGTLCPLQFTGFLPPVGGAGSTGGSASSPLRTYKLGSTIPIKMGLADCNGTPLVTGEQRLKVIPWGSATNSGPALTAVSTDSSTTGNAFRLVDPATGEWLFTLDTFATGMTVGVWEIRATLSDGSTHSAFIRLT